jgi:hypothetical protein
MTTEQPENSPSPDEERALQRPQRMKSFDFKAEAAFVVALAFAGVTLVFCCLAAITLLGPKCAGHEWAEGNRPIDFIALFFVSGVIVAMVAGLAFGTREWRGTFHEVNGVFVPFEYVAEATLGVALVMLGIVKGVSITLYQSILADCLATVAPS